MEVFDYPGGVNNPEELENPEDLDNPEHLDNPQDSDNLENLNYPEESDSLADLDYPEDSKNQDDLINLEVLNFREDLDITHVSGQSKPSKRKQDRKKLVNEPKKLPVTKSNLISSHFAIHPLQAERVLG